MGVDLLNVCDRSLNSIYWDTHIISIGISGMSYGGL